MSQPIKIKIPRNAKWVTHGKHAFIYRGRELDKACGYYGRNPDECALKVFYKDKLGENDTINDARWGPEYNPEDVYQIRKSSNLMQATKIQNILWLEGLSPRVYALFEAEYMGNKVAVQLIQYIKHTKKDWAKNRDELVRAGDAIDEIGKKYGFSAPRNILWNNDVINGQIVDIQNYEFDLGHEQKIKEQFLRYSQYGNDLPYQDVPEFEIQAIRDCEHRIEVMKLNEIDFRNKVVWDVGCATGFFCRYAHKMGAKRVVGFEEEDYCFAAQLMSNYLGYFNIDYRTMDVTKELGVVGERPDIVMYLSMSYHINPPKKMFEAETIIFEDNSEDTKDLSNPGKPWTDYYTDIKLVGRAQDQDNCQKPTYHLSRKKP